MHSTTTTTTATWKKIERRRRGWWWNHVSVLKTGYVCIFPVSQRQKRNGIPHLNLNKYLLLIRIKILDIIFHIIFHEYLSYGGCVCVCNCVASKAWHFACAVLCHPVGVCVYAWVRVSVERTVVVFVAYSVVLSMRVSRLYLFTYLHQAQEGKKEKKCGQKVGSFMWNKHV